MQIAFASATCFLCSSPDIYVLDADGHDVQRLTESSKSSGNRSPAWSPDDPRIAFVIEMPEERIFVVSIDRQNMMLLGVAFDPEWSPDSRRIAFTRGRPSDIWIMRSDGKGAHRVTRNPAAEHGPAWSPDGARIALSSARGIFVVNADGTRLHQITHGVGGIPVWSPDGAKLTLGRR